MSKYPERLIPNDEDTIIEEIDKNEIIGRANRNITFQTFTTDGSFNDSSVRVKEVPKLSCNLLSLSEVNDLLIEPLNESVQYGYQEWQKGIKTPNAEDIEFRYNNDWDTYFFKKKDIEIETTYDFEENEYVIKLGMKHVPVLINYSHSEFEITDQRRTEINNAEARVSKFSTKKPKPGQETLMHLLRRKLKRHVKREVSDL